MRSTKGDDRQAIHEALRRAATRGMKQQDIAKQANLAGSTITHLLHGQRPTAITLRKLVHAWEDAGDGIAILCAHLRDEIARAHVAEDMVSPITARGGDPLEDPSLQDAIHELRRAAKDSTSIRELLVDLAVVVRASVHAEARAHASDTRLAAESPVEYNVSAQKKGKRKG